MVLVARFAAGVGAGTASSVVPLYLSEIAPPAIRGRLVTINQLMITLGIVGSYGVGWALSSSDSWRAMFAAGLVPGAALLYGMLRSPETPVWLWAHGQTERAREVVSEIADGEDAERLLDDLRRSGPREEGLDGRRLLQSRARPALQIGVTLAVLQQLSGINAVFYYAPSIMEKAGLTASGSMVGAVIIGTVNVAATVVSFRLVDRLGRVPLLRISIVGMIASLVLLGLAITAGAAGWLSLVCILVYVSSFAIGMGPVFWLLVGEIFPPGSRAAGASVSTATNWFSNFVVGLAFLPVVAAIGQGPTFWIFAAACGVALVFVDRYVPETKGRSFTEIDRALHERRHPPRAAPSPRPRRRGSACRRPGGP
jgi:sugar porter (SP) family MFS transporter